MLFAEKIALWAAGGLLGLLLLAIILVLGAIMFINASGFDPS